MAPFDRSRTTFYSFAVVNIALSCTVFELFAVETWVRGHSRSFKSVLFESLDVVSYSPSIVTMALSCIICEKIVLFSYPLAFDAVGGSPSEY